MQLHTCISPWGTQLSHNMQVLAAHGNCVSVNGTILTYVFFYNTCFYLMFVLLTSINPRSFYFAEYEILTAILVETKL